VTYQHQAQGIYSRFLKRLCDFFIAVFLLIILSPVLITAALLVTCTSSGPIMFKQKRLGKHQRIFTVYKFRTMTNVKRVTTNQVRLNNPDITTAGYLLRRFKIDELPQLFNVLSGDMSLIGPRPCLPEDLKDFNDDGYIRLQVLPGLTGLAQVNGNTNLTWTERWAWDAYYVKHLNFLLDVRILWKTVGVVFYGESASIRKCC
jgi:undecaprenyl phosphate N,N'-diacetylbacillosamine 1-phosphate transferase